MARGRLFVLAPKEEEDRTVRAVCQLKVPDKSKISEDTPPMMDNITADINKLADPKDKKSTQNLGVKKNWNKSYVNEDLDDLANLCSEDDGCPAWEGEGNSWDENMRAVGTGRRRVMRAVSVGTWSTSRLRPDTKELGRGRRERATLDMRAVGTWSTRACNS